MHRPRFRRLTASIAVAATAALLATSCAGGSGGGTGADEDINKKVTIKFWHGWSQESEVKAINDLIAKFNTTHPNIKVEATPNVNDDKLTQGVRSSKGPDVVSSFTTDNVGQFCSSGGWVDLAPFVTKSGLDPAKTFPKATLDYTQFQGKRCALPFLADAYGLYYNKDMFTAAGITSPPKTMSEFKADAVKLQQLNADGSIKVAGVMPTFHGYEFTPAHVLAQWGPTYVGADGKSNLASTPQAAQMLTYQKELVEALGGFEKLEKFRAGFGEEFSAQNPFQAGQVAMQLDGEWRTASIAEDSPTLNYGTAPLPVPDDQADSYGRGYLTGTVIGIAKSSHHQAAAWEFIKFLTTDTDAVNSFAATIHNVPTTFAALDSTPLAGDEHFKPFLEVFKNPASNSTPASLNGGKYQVTFQEFCYAWEAGRVPDLKSGLAGVDKQIDTDTAQAKP
ncbi:ABC transporter substrate-binding protein [Yinghuangia seranimata]|uniref:ABC transporter substrate-binding protein n=1 Tax=Yinghuangia seranimata TaxID=408067 RepID=UPI00248C95CE|nr:ABC transporter substrate-binding protein [Yinghuangia seranimata]MDI2129821.1 ABC transporter substrate-binding protein [Yinghuangia seranimata]